jgi:hypothetical protein
MEQVIKFKALDGSLHDTALEAMDVDYEINAAIRDTLKAYEELLNSFEDMEPIPTYEEFIRILFRLKRRENT